MGATGETPQARVEAIIEDLSVADLVDREFKEEIAYPGADTIMLPAGDVTGMASPTFFYLQTVASVLRTAWVMAILRRR